MYLFKSVYKISHFNQFNSNNHKFSKSLRINRPLYKAIFTNWRESRENLLKRDKKIMYKRLEDIEDHEAPIKKLYNTYYLVQDFNRKVKI